MNQLYSSETRMIRNEILVSEDGVGYEMNGDVIENGEMREFAREMLVEDWYGNEVIVGSKLTYGEQLKQVVEGLEKLLAMGARGEVVVKTKLEPIVKGWEEWILNWKRMGWKNAQGKDVAFKEVWKEILRLEREFTRIRFVKI